MIEKRRIVIPERPKKLSHLGIIFLDDVKVRTDLGAQFLGDLVLLAALFVLLIKHRTMISDERDAAGNQTNATDTGAYPASRVIYIFGVSKAYFDHAQPKEDHEKSEYCQQNPFDHKLPSIIPEREGSPLFSG
jgi:hypothetical protein